jgi:hypothetical protein
MEVFLTTRSNGTAAPNPSRIGIGLVLLVAVVIGSIVAHKYGLSSLSEALLDAFKVLFAGILAIIGIESAQNKR